MTKMGAEVYGRPWTLMAPTVTAGHCFLYEVNHDNGKIYAINTMAHDGAWKSKGMKIGGVLPGFLNFYAPKKDIAYPVEFVDVPCQEDSVSCGPMICAIAEWRRRMGCWPTTADFKWADRETLRLLALQRVLEYFYVGAEPESNMSGTTHVEGPRPY